ncbi:hypothetical protein B9T25_13635 [Acinetobacter sp. ANC 4470]|uniref:hypothetical protein n=1 Tax=Acinetobacter sp. ANC 4470 TaxID=1977881 RepID=UPI000A337C94|nr:hypothetical protein [Acinetobacter sp. ANC 4470]OTG63532.1 hypothetical protein B9T25_13635 [Acinetobacter sp. ANC 4470]
MSYKHNNLMAMRQNYWNDTLSTQVLHEKKFFQEILIQHGIYTTTTEDDAKYLFFSLPSIIIVKGYSLGFQHDAVQAMIFQHIQDNETMLKQKSDIKIQFNM